MPPQNPSSLESQNVRTDCRTPLRVCCYGSSSKHTKEIYIAEAQSLGYILGKRDHICVNGAGATGCMGAMNQGVLEADGSVVGVIHKMFVSENENKGRSGWVEGCHSVFRNNKKSKLIIVGGDDLQERKRMLVKNADALIILPGGPGTFDELWEMVCSKQIGLIDIPICCVNVDGYYDSFSQMLKRAKTDRFLYKNPGELLCFVESSAEAIEYIEKVTGSKRAIGEESRHTDQHTNANIVVTETTIRQADEKKALCSMKILSTQAFQTLFRAESSDAPQTILNKPLAISFASGVLCGLLLQLKMSNKK